MLWWTMWGDLRRVSTDSWCCFPHLDFGLGIYVRHGPESQTVFVAFSCTFLIKVRLLCTASTSYNLSDIELVIATEIRVIYLAGTARRDHKNSRTRRRVSRCSRYRCRRSPWPTTLFSFHRRVTRACENPTNYFIPPSRSKRKSPGFSATVHHANLTPPVARQAVASLNYFEPLPKRTTTPFDHFAFSNGI
jgi:hypothetical protein